jgi:hypothetical protein
VVETLIAMHTLIIAVLWWFAGILSVALGSAITILFDPTVQGEKRTNVHIIIAVIGVVLTLILLFTLFH